MLDRQQVLARSWRYARMVALIAGERWQEIPHLWQRDDDGAGFVAFAAWHQLTQYVCGKIDAAGKAGLFPDDVVAGLRREAERRRPWTERLPTALAEIVAAFAAANVECLVLKGIPFAARYYGDPAIRRPVDIDLLVRRADADKGLRVLAGIGYRTKRRRIRDTAEGPSIRPHRLRTEHALGLWRGEVPVDLHWRLRTAPAYRLAEGDLWNGTQEMAFDGIRCRVPSDECALLLLLLSIAHDVGRSACRLKHLLDVRQIVRAVEPGMDWDRFFERRREENVLRISVNVLAIAVDLFGGEEEFPRLATALRPHARLRVGPAGPESLLHVVREGRIANTLWFAKVYPTAGTRDLVWLLDRYLSHPGRVLLAPWKLFRACYWSARRLLGTARTPA
jgi:hypothetical protein